MDFKLVINAACFSDNTPVLNVIVGEQLAVSLILERDEQTYTFSHALNESNSPVSIAVDFDKKSARKGDSLFIRSFEVNGQSIPVFTSDGVGIGLTQGEICILQDSVSGKYEIFSEAPIDEKDLNNISDKKIAPQKVTYDSSLLSYILRGESE